ncbi:MAG: ABC transporter ATP-binding protein, partial [Micrococcales bacterium]|nr:ABC transporter ATP-binding protein [Micrococcales bacterium]
THRSPVTAPVSRTGDRPEAGGDREQPPSAERTLSGVLDRSLIPEPGTPVLRVRGLTKRYGGVTAVSNVDLDVRSGEILGLIGPNGAGKTTCFNMISGVLAPTAGSVEVRGQRVEGRRPHVIAKLGATRTFQNLQVFGSTTVLGNVAVARHLRSHAGLLRGLLSLAPREERDIERGARAAVAAMGLEDDTDRPVKDLSFGRQRQVEVARALAMSPMLLMLDEPMAGLSGPERDELSALLRLTREAGIAVVLVEHDVDAVMALADRIAVLDDGTLIAEGAPDDVRQHPAVIAAYLGTDDDADLVLRRAAEEVRG